MPRIEMTGKFLKKYSGADTGGEKVVAITLYPGMTSEVSDKKAEQLLKDYPHDFMLVNGKPVKAEIEIDANAKGPLELEPKPTGKVPKKNKAIAPKKNKKG